MLRRVALLAALLFTAGCQVARTPAPVGVGLLRVGPPVRLTDRPALSPVAWAPDGAALAFTDGGGVWIAPLDRTRARARKVSAAGHATAVDWSVGTGLLAYIDRGAVVVLRPDEKGKRGIPIPSASGAPAFATHLAWAPQGDRLAVAVRDGSTGSSRGAVWLVSPDGGRRNQVFLAPPGQTVGALGWYPDSLFLFIGIGADGPVTRLLRWRITYLDRRTLPVGVARMVAPVLSPNGEWIAFAAASSGGGGGSVWVVAADGRSAPRQVGDGTGRVGGVTWAPTSDKVAFTRILDEGRGEIWIADGDGRGRRRIAQFVAEFPDPDLPLVARWSPDAHVLAYGTNNGTYRGHVWTVTLDRQ
jgi:Tol biopolymer transport system component